MHAHVHVQFGFVLQTALRCARESRQVRLLGRRPTFAMRGRMIGAGHLVTSTFLMRPSEAQPAQRQRQLLPRTLDAITRACGAEDASRFCPIEHVEYVLPGAIARAAGNDGVELGHTQGASCALCRYRRFKPASAPP